MNGNGNGNGRVWILKVAALILTIMTFIVAAPIWIEARIDVKVEAEATKRRTADAEIEARRDKQLDRIERKLDGIEEYIRDQ